MSTLKTYFPPYFSFLLLDFATVLLAIVLTITRRNQAKFSFLLQYFQKIYIYIKSTKVDESIYATEFIIFTIFTGALYEDMNTCR